MTKILDFVFDLVAFYVNSSFWLIVFGILIAFAIVFSTVKVIWYLLDWSR